MTRWRREGSLTKFISWFAPLLLEERDPARVSQIVRRVSGAYGAAAAVWAAVAGLLFGLHFAALIGAFAAAGHLLIALAARRWPYSAAVGFVAWIWVMGLVGQLRTGVLTSGGVFLAAIVAAGLVLGARAAIVTAVVTAIATGSIAFAVESGSFVPSGAQPSILAMWTLAVVTFAAMPVLLGEALGRLRRALNEAQEAERRYSLVADNTRDAIFLIEDGVLSYVSPGALALFGWSPAELLERGAGFQSFTPDSAQLARATLGRAMAEGASHTRYECEHLRKDGSTIWCEVDVSLLRDAGGRVTGVLGVTREISARRRAEADRERIQAELAHAQRMEIVGRIAASVAHDLNNQLAVILGTVEALSDESSTTRADAQKDVAAAAESAAALTRQLQIFSQRRATRRVPFDLNVLVRRLDRTLRRVVGTGIDLVVVAGASPAVVLADGAQIEQVILNLVMNARDAMPGGGRLSLEVAAGEGQRAALWLVRVGDTGSGIDDATRARLFEPFFTTKPEGSGTGLGLAMVQRIAEETGGSVSVQSELGCGTTFEVALPRYTGPIESEEELASDSDTQRAATILVVDDSVEILHLFGNVLSRHGYHVLEANSPAHALALAAQPIDLVVSDVVMPGMRGPELIRMLRKDRPDLPVLYVSGYVTEEFDISGDPRAAVLWKPFPMKALLRAVRQALAAAAQDAQASDAR